MRKDLLDHHRIVNAGDALDVAAAAVAELDIDVENAFQVLPGSMKTQSSCERALRPSHGGPAFCRRAGCDTRVQRESRYLADMGNGRLIATRQSLQGEHLAPRLRPHRDAVRDRVAQEFVQRAALHGIAAEIATLGIAFQ